MPRKRPRLNWTYDNDRQEFKTPSGRIVRLEEIAQAIYGHHQCHIDFNGPWSGWKMRGDRLSPPGTRVALKPDTTRAFLRWINHAAERGNEHQSSSTSPTQPAEEQTQRQNKPDVPSKRSMTTTQRNEPTDHFDTAARSRQHRQRHGGDKQRHQPKHKHIQRAAADQQQKMDPVA